MFSFSYCIIRNNHFRLTGSIASWQNDHNKKKHLYCPLCIKTISWENIICYFLIELHGWNCLYKFLFKILSLWLSCEILAFTAYISFEKTNAEAEIEFRLMLQKNPFVVILYRKAWNYISLFYLVIVVSGNFDSVEDGDPAHNYGREKIYILDCYIYLEIVKSAVRDTSYWCKNVLYWKSVISERTKLCLQYQLKSQPKIKKRFSKTFDVCLFD